MVNTMQQVGGSIGTALLSSIFASAVAPTWRAAADAAGHRSEAAVHGYTVAFWVAAGVFAFGAVVVGLTMESIKVASSRRASPPSPTDRLVVLPGVDVARDRARHGHLGDRLAGAVHQPPDALVAVQRGELAERAAREGERVAAAVVVAAGGERRLAAARHQRRDRRRRHAGLVAEQEHEDVNAGVDRGERGGDGGGASRAVRAVLDDLGAGQVDLLADALRPAAEHADELVEGARAGRVEHVAEQRPAAVGQQLLGLPEPARAARREHEPGDPLLSARRHAPPRTARDTLAAEVEPLAAEVEVDARVADRDLHPADRVDGDRERAGAGAVSGGCAVRSATSSARIEIATSLGARAPMSSPAGVWMSARSASGTSSESRTAAPRVALATSPT